MANLSSASGTITVGGTSTTAKLLSYLFAKLSNDSTDYVTNYVKEYTQIDLDTIDLNDLYPQTKKEAMKETKVNLDLTEKDIQHLLHEYANSVVPSNEQKTNEKTFFEFDFTGTGRWAYINNIQFFASWAYDQIKDDELYLQIFNLFFGKDSDKFWMKYCYTDEESGVGFIANVIVSINHQFDPTAKEATYELVELGYVEHDYTAANLREYCGYDEEEVFDLNDVDTINTLIKEAYNDETLNRNLEEIHAKVLETSPNVSMAMIIDKVKSDEFLTALNETVMEQYVLYGFDELFTEYEDDICKYLLATL